MKNKKRLSPDLLLMNVLIICSIGLMTITAVSQEKRVCLDSNQVKAVELLINDNEMLNKINANQGEQIELYKANERLKDDKIFKLEAVIGLKEQQIKELEGIRIPVVIDSKWKWWHYTLAFIGAVTFGFTAGIIYENTR